MIEISGGIPANIINEELVKQIRQGLYNLEHATEILDAQVMENW